MLIVSDTTPIITLMKMGHLDILKQLYGKVLIPNAVYMELTSNEKFATEVFQVIDSDFLEVEKVDNEVAVTILQEVSGLDAGESEDCIEKLKETNVRISEGLFDIMREHIGK